jgi:hypothetical protein
LAAIIAACFLVNELLRWNPMNGGLGLSSPLLASSVEITVTFFGSSFASLFTIVGFAFFSTAGFIISWSLLTPDDELSPSPSWTPSWNALGKDFDDFNCVRIFWISSTENECAIEPDPVLDPDVLLLPLVSATGSSFAFWSFLLIVFTPPFTTGLLLTFVANLTELSASSSDSDIE